MVEVRCKRLCGVCKRVGGEVFFQRQFSRSPSCTFLIRDHPGSRRRITAVLRGIAAFLGS